MRRLVVVCAAALVGACVSGPGQAPEGPAPDYEQWVEVVQPILSEHCGNPSCHGNGDRPLEVFGVHQHRLDPADVYRDIPLTAEELAIGYEKARAFVHVGAAADDCLLLRKPTATALGGAPHAGGVQFELPSEDGDFLALWDWVASATGEGGP